MGNSCPLQSAQPFGGKPKLMILISERNGSAMWVSSVAVDAGGGVLSRGVGNQGVKWEWVELLLSVAQKAVQTFLKKISRRIARIARIRTYRGNDFGLSSHPCNPRNPRLNPRNKFGELKAKLSG
jgi:hypothetical protein